MPLPPDYHMHTQLCHHAEGVPYDLALSAARRGLTEIGLSEHNPMPRDDFDNWHMALAALDGYLDGIRLARERVPQLTLRAALEVDYIPGHEDWIRQLAARHDWDYFIGSVHYIDGGWDIDNPAKLDQWRARDAFDVWAKYFDRLTAAASSGLFQIIGHPDLPKKFGFVPGCDCTPLFETFLDAAARHGVAIEINTAGLRKPCREMYPAPAFLRLARQRGVLLTFGSDAHHPDEVAADFPAAVALARDCGYTETVRFEQRRPIPVPL
ncbi:MAG: histidinol-phosphatase HisJ family protein [Verrucomicrobiae bacterium]|nr:histidinol-phosphatase HisJ family protein [Verrucomicrobiae bacterium]